ncbi:monofunctional C1-tetrahydrofolate synthase, mitochondrial isoform X6 [Manis pentadactyla]|uniref:monofunctional C1-tetrahydrofolate synthase, mitochondrial isoform X6 n=1 Tax=Manis pentadactyla TaxID=143292 RepID=UPI00255C7F02|nr:monofunctional C1-tetrahydrofolate synthase, mitochondrial isoform X6 [Manis pentadactyla]
MSARLPLFLRQLRRPLRPPGPPRRSRAPCRASSGSGGCGGGKGPLGPRRLQDSQAGSSRGPGSLAPPARGSIVREVIQNSKEVLGLLQEKNPTFKPVLAIIQAGGDNLMQEINQNLAEEAGLNITHICLPPDSGEDEIIDEILKINEDSRVHGLALQISESSFSNKVLNALKPEKDVDGVTDINLGKLVRGDAHECFISPVARAVTELLEKSGVNLDGKKILVIGAHGSFEAAIQCLFQRKGSMTMSSQWKAPQLQSKLQEADIVVIGSPKPKEIPLSWIQPGTTVLNCSHDFLTALFTIAKKWKQPKCPSVDEWIKKMWYIYTMEYYSALRRKQILPFATTWMELEGIMLSEISQAEKDKYQMTSLICGV